MQVFVVAQTECKAFADFDNEASSDYTNNQALTDLESAVALFAKHRAVRDTSNPLLEFVQGLLGPTFLAIQEVIDNLLTTIISVINSIRSLELYTVIAFVLSTYGVSIDSILEYVESIQTNIDALFANLTGSS